MANFDDACCANSINFRKVIIHVPRNTDTHDPFDFG